MKRDAIIVGAGPAGATTATVLARSGRDVLLLDRAQFPRDKTCGDGIVMDVVNAVADLGVAEKLLAAGFQSIDSARVVSPGGYVLDARRAGSGFTAPRRDFDNILLAHAVESGAQFVQGHVDRPLVEEGRVVGVTVCRDGRREDLRARVVVGADGAASAVAGALRKRPRAPVHRGLAIRGYMDGLDLVPSRTEFYADQGTTYGYGWVFPVNESTANVGVGMRLDVFYRQRRTLRELLAAFLARPELRERTGRDACLRDVKAWPEDLATDRRVVRAFDGALLVGDAAALVDPFDGGGILNAVLSARLAGCVIDRALRRGDVTRATLSPYEGLCRRFILKQAGRRLWLRRAITVCPALLDGFVRWARRDERVLHRFIEKAYSVVPRVVRYVTESADGTD